MSIHQIRDLALKILGLFYLSKVIVLTPQIPRIFFSLEGSPAIPGQRLAIALSVLLPLAFWAFIGLTVTFRTRLVAAALWPSLEEPETGTPTRPSLRFWIVLIGFFFFVSAVGGAVTELWIFAYDSEILAWGIQYRFLPDLMTLVLSIICILNAQAIETWLRKRIGEDSQSEVG